ncbi:MAG: M28 family peptidase [candidate division KSB1 bacterium]
MRVPLAAIICLFSFFKTAHAQPRALPLLPDSIVAALSHELSGEQAKRNLEYLARHHRMRGSQGFHAAANFIAEQLRGYGLLEVKLEQLPADGKTFYGPQKARKAWDAEFAELWEVQKQNGAWQQVARLASREAMPVSLAQDSESGEALTELIDVGNGTSEKDYANKNVRGKLVLVAAQPGAVVKLAVKKYGAAGILSYAQNQRTGWWRENENLVRWGHLDSFSATPTFAFMLSLKQARALQARLAAGETITLHAQVRAGKHEGNYEVVTATIPGFDAKLKDEEIAFSCHLDHQLPGANDNASGSVAILEVARTFARLIQNGKLARPSRTLRFIWPPEIEGTHALLNARPELAQRIKAVIHMDMVGGGPETKAIFHVTRGPASLPSVVNDIAETIGAFVNEQSQAFASGQETKFPLLSVEGGKEALQADFAEFTMGSDHEVYTDACYGIPAIYLNDWPDRYIHTNFDTPANIDPTKLKRAAFIGAASALVLANLSASEAPRLWQAMQPLALRRTATLLQRRAASSKEEANAMTRFHLWHERALFESQARFMVIPASVRREAEIFYAQLETLVGKPLAIASVQGEGRLIFQRTEKFKGPLSTFGYDYFTDHLSSEAASAVRLLQYRGERGSGGEYAYEALNFVDGKRNAQEIFDALAAIYGAVPMEMIMEYLRALEKIEVVQQIK